MNLTLLRQFTSEQLRVAYQSVERASTRLACKKTDVSPPEHETSPTSSKSPTRRRKSSNVPKTPEPTRRAADAGAAYVRGRTISSPSRAETAKRAPTKTEAAEKSSDNTEVHPEDASYAMAFGEISAPPSSLPAATTASHSRRAPEATTPRLVPYVDVPRLNIISPTPRKPRREGQGSPSRLGPVHRLGPSPALEDEDETMELDDVAPGSGRRKTLLPGRFKDYVDHDDAECEYCIRVLAGFSELLRISPVSLAISELLHD